MRAVSPPFNLLRLFVSSSSRTLGEFDLTCGTVVSCAFVNFLGVPEFCKLSAPICEGEKGNINGVNDVTGCRGGVFGTILLTFAFVLKVIFPLLNVVVVVRNGERNNVVALLLYVN